MSFRERAKLPTGAEMRILNAIWSLGSATVEDVVQSFPEEERPNYKTTQAFLRIMENKGFVRHTARGRVFVFEALVKKDEVDRRSVEALLARNFGGSARSLLLNLLEACKVEEKDLTEMHQTIREYRQRRQSETDTRQE